MRAFAQSRTRNVCLLGGRPLFPDLRCDVTPDEMLAGHGLKPGPEQVLDAAAGVTLGTRARRENASVSEQGYTRATGYSNHWMHSCEVNSRWIMSGFDLSQGRVVA